MRILIVGNSYSAKIFADTLAQDSENLVFTTAVGIEATCVDINYDDVEELKEFALANEIDLTIVCDTCAITQNFTEVFHENNLAILTPDNDANGIVTSRAFAKKFMYKNKILTPKFGIFDKPQLAIDWARAQKQPIIIKQNKKCGDDFKFAYCETFPKAKKEIEILFESGVNQVVMEVALEGTKFSLYVLSDGYNFIDITYVTYHKDKFAYLGANFVDEKLDNKIKTEVVIPTISSLCRFGSEYVGILGFDFILDSRGNLYTTDYRAFFNDLDIEFMMANTLDNFAKMCESTIKGTVLDDFAITKKANMNFISMKDENNIYMEYGRTLNEAREKMLEEHYSKELANWQF